MAAVEKLFGNINQYTELWNWLEKNNPDTRRYMSFPYQEGHSIALFPESIDAYLLEECPLAWVVEQIRAQYCLDEGGEPPDKDTPE